MKYLLYIALALMVLSCARNKAEEMVSTEAIDNEKSLELATSEASIATYTGLAQQKLQDYFDLLVLQNEHPEFKAEIISQLEQLSEDTISLPEDIASVSIENVEQRGDIENVSDSVQKMTLDFDIVSTNFRKKDSINVLIHTQWIDIDGEKLPATKVSFEKNY